MDGIVINLNGYVKFVFAFIFVLALIALAAVTARRFGFGLPSNPRNSTKRRLGIQESLNIDGKRRMVLVRRDEKEHLLLLGATSELVIESSITSSKSILASTQDESDDVTGSNIGEAYNVSEPNHKTPLPKNFKRQGTNRERKD